MSKTAKKKTAKKKTAKKKTAKNERVFLTRDGVAMPIFENGVIVNPPNRKP